MEGNVLTGTISEVLRDLKEIVIVGIMAWMALLKKPDIGESQWKAGNHEFNLNVKLRGPLR